MEKEREGERERDRERLRELSWNRRRSGSIIVSEEWFGKKRNFQ